MPSINFLAAMAFLGIGLYYGRWSVRLYDRRQPYQTMLAMSFAWAALAGMQVVYGVRAWLGG